MSTCLVLDICIKISHVEHSKVNIFSGRSRMPSRLTSTTTVHIDCLEISTLGSLILSNFRKQMYTFKKNSVKNHLFSTLFIFFSTLNPSLSSLAEVQCSLWWRVTAGKTDVWRQICHGNIRPTAHWENMHLLRSSSYLLSHFYTYEAPIWSDLVHPGLTFLP